MARNIKPVILLPGLDFEGSLWEKVETSLKEKDIEFYSLDFPRYGKLHEGVMMDFIGLSGYLKKKLQELSLGRPVVLVGHSLGGLVSVIYSAKYPDDVDSLVLSSTPLRNPDSFTAKDYKFMVSLFHKSKIAREFARFIVSTFGSFSEDLKVHRNFLSNTDLEAVLSCLYDLMYKFRFEDYINKIDKKTILFYGKKDRPLLKVSGDKLYSKFRNAKIIAVDITHSIPLAYPELITKEILELSN
jgi:pimeloyl-ACP methyl ester carboxylesterase